MDLGQPALAGRTGRGVAVAVVDSGINPWHPHIAGVAGGVAMSADGSLGEDFIDAVGHGTAVAAVIHEKAPEAELYAVRIFGQALATRAEILVRAIDWAVDRGIRLINLSLGTAKPERAPLLQKAVGRAAARGAVIVSASDHGDQRWLPGSLDGVAGVWLDWDCPRHEIRITVDHRDNPVFRASGYPRPIPGVPPQRNLHGISFAVANVTGFLARLLEGRPELRRLEDVLALLASDQRTEGPAAHRP